MAPTSSAMRGTRAREAGRHAVGSLAILLLTALALAAALWRIAGPPWIPDGSDVARLPHMLAGADVADGQLIALGTVIAWGLLAYLALTVAVRAMLLAAERATGGARWVRKALKISRLITIPAVRRVVDGGVAGALLLASSVAAPSRALAVAPQPIVIFDRPAASVPVLVTPATDHDSQEAATAFVAYTVQRGDYLWDIARRFYGDGSRYVRIFEANRGRELAGGGRLTDPRVIEPGWVLAIPLPATNLVVGDVTRYRVAPGDDLWGIAARLLGDGFRWTEIFSLNDGREMSDGRRFTDPSAIFPGWLLQVPVPASPPPSNLDRPPSPPGTLASPTPRATSVIVTPEPPPVSEAAHRNGEWGWPVIPREAWFTAAGFLVLGGVAVFVHRIRQSGLLRVPGRRVPEEPVGDAARVTLAVRALTTVLRDLGIDGALVLTAHESRHGIRCALRATAEIGAAIVERQREIERRLGCGLRMGRPAVERLEVTLTSFHRLAASFLAGDPNRTALVVPVGADQDGIVYLNLAAVGAVGLATAGDDRRRLLRAWVATLVTTTTPDQVAIRVDAETAGVLGDLLEAPQFAGAPASRDAAELLTELEALVEVRRGEESPRMPVLWIVTCDPDTDGALSEVSRLGASAGVFVIANVQEPELFQFPCSIRDVNTQVSADADAVDGLALAGIVLSINGEDRRLDPVYVRRDLSRRWRPSGADESEPPASLDEWRRQVIEDEDYSSPADETDDRDRSTDPSSAFTEPPADYPELGVLSPTSGADRDDGPLTGSQVECSTVAVAEPAVAVAPPVQIAQADGRSAHRGDRQLRMFADAAPDRDEDGAACPSSMFSVRCLGKLEIELDGTPIVDWQYQKAPELLAFMIAQGVPVSREKIAEALWPDVPWDDSLKHSLANLASGLRNVLRSATGRPDLRILTSNRHGRYEFDASLFAVDLDVVEEAFRRAGSASDAEALPECDRAFAAYRGDFLSEIDAPWASTYRMELRRRFEDALRRAIAIARRSGDRDRLIRYCRIALTDDPTDETMARQLMQALGEAGDFNGARKVYRVLTEAIQQDLDDPLAAPGAETRTLLEALIAEARSA